MTKQSISSDNFTSQQSPFFSLSFFGSIMLSVFFYLHVGVSPFQDEKKASKEKVGVNSWMSNMSGAFCWSTGLFSFEGNIGHPISFDAPMIPSGGSLLMNRASSFESFSCFVLQIVIYIYLHLICAMDFSLVSFSDQGSKLLSCEFSSVPCV